MTNQAACMAAATALSVHVEQKGRFRPSRSRLGAVSPAASAAVTVEPRSAESASGMAEWREDARVKTRRDLGRAR